MSIFFTLAVLTAGLLASSASAFQNFTYSSTIGGPGSGNGQFTQPSGVVTDATGNFLVADRGNDRIEKFNAKGEYLSQFGNTGENLLDGPTDLAIDSKGNIWVADTLHNRIMKFDSEGKYLAKAGEFGVNNGQFREPSSLAIDSEDNVWVTDTTNNRVQKFSSSGAFLSTFSGPFSEPLSRPHGIAIDASNNIWVLDGFGNGTAVKKFNSKGEYLSQFGKGILYDATGPALSLDAEGNLWISCSQQRWVTVFNTKGEELAKFNERYWDGESTAPQPSGIAFDSSGNPWIAFFGTSHIEKWEPATKVQLRDMAVTEPFNGTATSIANFEANWSTLGWVGKLAKGRDSASGWHPVLGSPTQYGTFYNSTVTDTGPGIAVAATMAANPGATAGRYFSLWLDMSTPSSTRSGYELRFTVTSANVYDVTLYKWEAGEEILVGSKTGYAFADGNSLALVDQGKKVSAWTNTGSGFSELLSWEETGSGFSGGNAGIEAAGLALHLVNFKVGSLQTAVVSMSAALNSVPVKDAFSTTESPLSGGGAWSGLFWDNGASGHNTGRVSGGWGPYDEYPTINGAYSQKATVGDTGAGNAAVGTLVTRPGGAGRYFSLWLDMPSPGSARTGYEMRFTATSTSDIYEVALSKWQAGTKTVLASNPSYSLLVGDRFALVSKGGTVSAWRATTFEGSKYTQALSASDSTFNNGYTGVEGSGNITRLKDFRSGPLPPF